MYYRVRYRKRGQHGEAVRPSHIQGTRRSAPGQGRGGGDVARRGRGRRLSKDAGLVKAVAGTLRRGGTAAAELRKTLAPAMSPPRAKTGAELIAFLRASPLCDTDFAVERDRTVARTAGRSRMTGFLIDTNVISETVKRRPEARVLAWFEERTPTELTCTSPRSLSASWYGAHESSTTPAGDKAMNVGYNTTLRTSSKGESCRSTGMRRQYGARSWPRGTGPADHDPLSTRKSRRSPAFGGTISRS